MSESFLSAILVKLQHAIEGITSRAFAKSCRIPLRSKWTLETLDDFWHVKQYMEIQRQKGSPDAALGKYYNAMTRIFRENINRYEHLVETLDKCADGIYQTPQAANLCGIKLPDGVCMLDNMKMLGKKLAHRLDDMLTLKKKDSLSKWNDILSHSQQYAEFLLSLVQDFGCFEGFVVALPGTGLIITNPKTQACLEEMFRINNRHIRILEFIRGVYLAWHRRRPHSSAGFFRTDTNLSGLARHQLLEYMRESDPARIATMQSKAKKAGRVYFGYRFKRPAECLRRLGMVEYPENHKIHPKQTRNYIQSRTTRVPNVCCDYQRVDWAIKEVLNNSIAATAKMYIEDSRLHIDPLEKHDVGNPEYAVSMKVKIIKNLKNGMRRSGKIIRLTISDNGGGMPREISENALLWGFSNKRQVFRNLQEKNTTDNPKAPARQPVIIGGKGIGLSYARAVIREHGGDLHLTSKDNEGTIVTIDLPAETSFSKNNRRKRI